MNSLQSKISKNESREHNIKLLAIKWQLCVKLSAEKLGGGAWHLWENLQAKTFLKPGKTAPSAPKPSLSLSPAGARVFS